MFLSCGINLGSESIKLARDFLQLAGSGIPTAIEESSYRIGLHIVRLETGMSTSKVRGHEPL